MGCNISEINREIDKLNLMRALNGGNAGLLGGRRLSISGISEAGIYFYAKTGRFIEKTTPYLVEEARLFNLDLR